MNNSSPEDFIEADFVEAEFAEEDFTGYEVPFELTNYYQRDVSYRLNICISFFIAQNWNFSWEDVKTLRDYFRAIPNLKGWHLLRLLHRGGHSIGSPFQKFKKAPKSGFDSAFHARKITDVKSFLKLLPKLVASAIFPSEREMSPELLADEDMGDLNHAPYRVVYSLLSQKLAPRHTEQLAIEIVPHHHNIHSTPHLEISALSETHQQLKQKVEIGPMPKPKKTRINSYKASVIRHLCRAAQVDEEFALLNASRAEREDHDHYPEEFFLLRGLGHGIFDSRDSFYCDKQEFGLEHSDVWDVVRLKETPVWNRYQDMKGVRPPEHQPFFHLAFGQPNCHFVLSQIWPGYELTGGLLVGNGHEAYVIQPIENWFKSRFPSACSNNI